MESIEKNEIQKRIIVSQCYKPQLRVKIYQYDGQQFEDFFTEVMRKINPNYRNPKPRGSFGDGKCDGFLQDTGEYFQCYAPEEIRDKTNSTNKKIENTIKTIIEEWGQISPIKKVFFVINDKFDDVDKGVYDKISELNQIYKPVQIKELLMSDFEKMFFEKLNFNQIEEILGYVPNDWQLLETLDGKMVLEIIKELLEMVEEEIPDKKIFAPLIDDKMEYNKLNSEIRKFLDRGYADIYFLQDYFKKNKENEELLKSLFIKAYEESCKVCKTNDEKFFYIVDKLCRNKKRKFRNEFFIIISYYFSYCDIFEDPPNKLKETIR